MKYEAMNGVLDGEVKILKLNPLMLYVYSDSQPVNCIVAKHAFNFFYQLKKDSRIALYGHYK